MTVKLNHHIVHARDKAESAAFLCHILGLPPAQPMGPFLGVRLGNDVTLDFQDGYDRIDRHHYAFRVDEDEFDAIFGRIVADRLTYWADPMHTRPGEVNRRGGGRGLYFEDPSGHNLEILTYA